MKYAEFCAGVGGFSLGLNLSGANVQLVYSNEIDNSCEKTYELNFKRKFDSKDIFAVNTGELPDFDMLCAGFPCQPYPAKKVIPKNDIKAHKAECLNYKLRNNQTRIKAVQKA